MMNINKNSTCALLGAALVAGTVQASAQNEGLLGGVTEGLSGELYAGYDTEYFYRGLWFGGDNAWTGVDFSKTLCDGITGSFGAYYLDTVADTFQNYSESGLSATLSWDTGAGTIDAGFTYFTFQNGFDGVSFPSIAAAGPFRGGQSDASEFSLTYSTEDFYGFSGYVQAVWDVRIDAGYLEAGLAQSVDFGFASLDLSAAVGYSVDGYYTAGVDAENGFTHALFSAALPIQLTETLTLTPHISANYSMESRDGLNNSFGQNDFQVFGGASLSVAF